MPPAPSKSQRWYPTKEQLKPENLERSFRQLLAQHYNLQDRFNVMQERLNTPASATSSGPPPGSGPADTMILGLRVAPVDVETLTNGATLKFDKKNGNFSFS